MTFESLTAPKSKLLITLDELADETPEPWLKPHGILDVFDHCLSEEEVDKTPLGGKNSLVEHNLVNEPKFVDFLERAMLLNENEEILIEVVPGIFSDQDTHDYLEKLDYEGKPLLFELIRTNNLNSIFLKTKNLKLTQFFMRLATRELSFPIFHFSKYKMSLCGNFDLSFPILFENEKLKKQYTEVAWQAGLFIRQ